MDLLTHSILQVCFLTPMLIGQAADTKETTDDNADAEIKKHLDAIEAQASGDVLIVECNGTYGISTIQSAIDAAEDGDTIVVLPRNYLGIKCDGNRYMERIDFKGKAVTVRGLIPGDRELVRRTTIDGAQEGTVVTMEHGEPRGAVLDGFSITGGKAASNGGGISINYGCPIIRNCVIIGNEAGYQGGGIHCGMYTRAVIRNCRIKHNKAAHGGGIAIQGALPTISNCVIAQNVAASGGGLSLSLRNKQTLTIRQCTIAGNVATSMGGGGIKCHVDHKLNLERCILWDNKSCKNDQVFFWDRGQIEVTDCDVQGGRDTIRFFLEESKSPLWGDGNIDADPLFADVSVCDYTLPPNSPCLKGAVRSKQPIGYVFDASDKFLKDLDSSVECKPYFDSDEHWRKWAEQKEQDRKAMKKRLLAFRFERTREEELKHLKSSVLGVELTYPANWQREDLIGFGNGMHTEPKTWEQRMRAPVTLVNGRYDVPWAEIVVTVRQAFDGKLDDFLKELEFEEASWDLVEFAPGLRGVRTIAQTESRRGKTWQEIEYVVVHDRRAVHIRCACPLKAFPVLVGVFDQIAQSLRIFTPMDNWPRPGTTKVFKAAGYSFEYPGEWVWAHPKYDDAVAESRNAQFMTVEWMGLKPEDYDPSQQDIPMLTAMGSKRMSLQQHKDYLERLRAAPINTVETSEPFVTAEGRQGLRTVFGSGSRFGIYYAVEMPSGGLILLNFSCSNGLEKWESTFERIAESLVLTPSSP